MERWTCGKSGGSGKKRCKNPGLNDFKSPMRGGGSRGWGEKTAEGVERRGG